MGGMALRAFVRAGVEVCAVVGGREGSVVGVGGRVEKEAVRRRWSFIASEFICLGMRQGNGTTEENIITIN